MRRVGRWPSFGPKRRTGCASPVAWVEQGHAALLDAAFHFDNEGPRHRTLLAPFDLASRPVTYGEFLAFMDDAGYQRPELWLSMGWDWVRTCGAAGVPPAPL